MQTDTVSIDQFIKDNRISMTAERTERNPNMADSASMDHWKVVLNRKTVAAFQDYHTDKVSSKTLTSRMTTYFSMGSGHNGAEPKADEVLDCLSSDASGYENAQSFEDWCSAYGYETDSRKAEKTYKAVEHASKRLKTFLGEELYSQLLWNTERM